jgi:hypothetical protein
VSIFLQQCKGKVKLSLCMPWSDMAEWRHTSIQRGEGSILWPGCFTPREEPPTMHWIGGWVHPRFSLDTLLPHLQSHHNSSTVKSVAYQVSVLMSLKHSELHFSKDKWLLTATTGIYICLLGYKKIYVVFTSKTKLAIGNSWPIAS